MHLLKHFWPALLLSLGAAVAYGINPQSTLTAVSLALAGVTWIGLGWRASRPPAADASESVSLDQVTMPGVRESICNIVERVNLFIDEEVGILRGSLQQIESLAEDAVSTLSQSLHSLNHQVQRQSKLLHDLAGISADREVAEDEEETFNLGRYVDDSESVIRYFLDLLDEVTAQRDGYDRGVSKLRDQVAELRTTVAMLPGDDGRAVRRQVATLKATLDIDARSPGAEKNWDQERDTAARAIDRMGQTRRKLQSMQDVVAMSVASFSQQSSKDVGEAIRSLQFEDIVTQLVTGATGRLDEMNRLVKTLSDRVDHLRVIDTAEEPTVALEVVKQIDSDVAEYSERLRVSRRKAVGQSDLKEGSVELF